MMDRSWKVALPAPAPPPGPMVAPLVTPQENDSTSISSLCLASADSPLMSPIFAKMSDAIWYTSTIQSRDRGPLAQPRVEAAIFRVSTETRWTQVRRVEICADRRGGAGSSTFGHGAGGPRQ